MWKTSQRTREPLLVILYTKLNNTERCVQLTLYILGFLI